MKTRLNEESNITDKTNKNLEVKLESQLKLSKTKSQEYRKSEEDKFSSRQMLLQLHEVKESLSKQRLNKLEELAKKIKIQTSTLQKNQEANQQQRDKLLQAKEKFWDEEETDLKRELIIKRFIVSYKSMKFSKKDKVLKNDLNSYKNILRIMSGDDNSQVKVEPKDYDKKKLEIYDLLTTYQKKNATFEQNINKIKNEIKEAEIRPFNKDETSIIKKEGSENDDKDEYDKINNMT